MSGKIYMNFELWMSLLIANIHLAIDKSTNQHILWFALAFGILIMNFYVEHLKAKEIQKRIREEENEKETN